jgi:TrmH family RNA methyltransferase
MHEEAAVSARDPRVVRAVRLLARDVDDELVALDGPELIDQAIAEGLVLRYVLAEDPEAWEHVGAPVALAGKDALRALGALGQPAQVVAIARLPEPPEPALPPGSLVLAGVAGAGNLGSILRTAAAFGVPRAVLAGRCADPWARRALRASMGAALRPGLVAHATALADVAALAERAPLAAAVPRGGVAPGELPDGAAIVLGSEREGLGREDRALCDVAVTVRAPGFESLNVAAAAAALLALRPPPPAARPAPAG